MSTASDDPLDALQGWLTLLPALALAVPVGLLHGVPTTVSTGIGWTLLLALPAALSLAARRKPVGFAGSTLLLGVLAWASYRGTEAGDPFEARRAILALSVGFALSLSAASLQAAGRRVLVRGFTIVAALHLIGAAMGPEAGVGNSGHLTHALLPGLVAAAAMAPDLRQPVALVLALGAALFFGLTPVLTGVAALAVTGLAAFAVRRTLTATWLLGAAAIAVLAFLATSGAPAESAEEGAPVAAQEHLGGVEFRTRTWSASAALFADAPLLGAGPGQFAREFPPHRDPVERKLSNQGGAQPTPVEVEHPHNDLLQGWLEFGAVGGVPWTLLLGLVLWHAWRRARDEDPIERALGLAAIAALASALVHSPLLQCPTGPAVLFPLIGAVLMRENAGRGASIARWLPVLAAVLLMLRADGAWRFVQHGNALAKIGSEERFKAGQVEGLDAKKIAPHIGDALVACDDSVIALEKRAELLDALGDAEERARTLNRLIDARPHHFAALLNRAVLHARAGDLNEAKALFVRARALAPGDARVLRNLAFVSAESYDPDLCLSCVQDLIDAGLEGVWVNQFAARVLLAGNLELGRELVARVAPEVDLTSAELAYAEYKRKEGSSGDEKLLADAALATANLLWARSHVEQKSYETAVRMYRQAVQISRETDGLPGGDALLRLEFAAAYQLAGRDEDAREEVEAANATPRHWARMPDWAGKALFEAGLMGS